MLSKNLTTLRKLRGWSRRVFCEKFAEFRKKKLENSEIKPGIYQKYEEGATEPDINKLCLLADFYSLTLDQLIREDLTAKIQEKMDFKEPKGKKK